MSAALELLGLILGWAAGCFIMAIPLYFLLYVFLRLVMGWESWNSRKVFAGVWVVSFFIAAFGLIYLEIQDIEKEKQQRIIAE